MEKLVYLIDASLAPLDLKMALVGPLGKEITQANSVHELEVYVCEMAEEDLIGLENNMDPHGLMSASISVWVDSLDDRKRIESVLAEVSTRIAGYSVTESVPREYQNRDWPDGETSPTLTIGTAMIARQDINQEEFFKRWHESHTPLSLKIHPLTRYVRNVVSRVLTVDAPNYHGLVFESVRSLEILSSVEYFYGNDKNREIAINDLLSFVDLSQMATKPMTETIVKSAPWRRHSQ